MIQADFLDFSLLAVKKFWKKYHVSTISHIRISPDEKMEIAHSYNTSETVSFLYNKSVVLPRCFDSPLEMDANKVKDLLSLMDSKLIPEKYRQSYRDLGVCRDK